jgi:hypothetical protein
MPSIGFGQSTISWRNHLKLLCGVDLNLLNWQLVMSQTLPGTAKGMASFPEILSFGDQGYGDELLRGAWMTLQISSSAYALSWWLALRALLESCGEVQ